MPPWSYKKSDYATAARNLSVQLGPSACLVMLSCSAVADNRDDDVGRNGLFRLFIGEYDVIGARPSFGITVP